MTKEPSSENALARKSRARCWVAGAAVLLGIGVAASADGRAALVIGNAAYEHVPPLANPRNDAEDMAGLLRRLGFVVTEGLDLTDAAMEDRIRAFARQAKAAEVALLFYAGHGLQVGGVNYLLPVDARLADEADLPFEAVALDLVLRSMGTGTNLVFLDACRDNPFIRTWAGAGRSVAGGRGLTRVGQESASGMFIAFATDPDSIAADGEGRNSPFTAALKRHIETPGLEVNSLLTEVRKTVLASTGNMQRPWSNSSLSAAFYFVPPLLSPVGDPAPRPVVGAPDPAAEAWKQIQATDDAQQLERYIAAYPNSPYRTAAEFRLNELRLQPFTVTPKPPNARVRLVDRSEHYQAGMMLPAGEYRVEVSADGYESQEVTVQHDGSLTTQHVALHKVGPKVGDQFRDCPECPEMVVVPAGSYRMGSPPHEPRRQKGEGPMHRVAIAAPFAVGKYEVTFAEWDVCMEAGGCGAYRPGDRGRGRGQRPVIDVSWDDAKRYVQWLSRKTKKPYRLLSESEWEYAARAGMQTAYSWGDQIGSGRANCYLCGGQSNGRQTAPVGSFAANRWGLHDMHGNVREWVEDCFNDTYAGPNWVLSKESALLAQSPRDGTAWLKGNGNCSKRVVRGGSYSNRPEGVRAAVRAGLDNKVRYPYQVGIRVAQTLANALPVSDRAAPPSVPLRKKLGAHLLALSTIYADGGSQAVQTYAKAAGLNLPEQGVTVQVFATSERDVAGLEQRIEEVGGSVQSTFENSIFATLPVPELGALASGEAVWRMDMQHAVLAPAEVVDLETEHGGRNAK